MTWTPKIAHRPSPLCEEATVGGAADAKWVFLQRPSPGGNECVLGGVASLKDAGGCRPSSCISRSVPLISIPPRRDGSTPCPHLEAFEPLPVALVSPDDIASKPGRNFARNVRQPRCLLGTALLGTLLVHKSPWHKVPQFIAFSTSSVLILENVATYAASTFLCWLHPGLLVYHSCTSRQCKPLCMR